MNHENRYRPPFSFHESTAIEFGVDVAIFMWQFGIWHEIEYSARRGQELKLNLPVIIKKTPQQMKEIFPFWKINQVEKTLKKCIRKKLITQIKQQADCYLLNG